MPYHPEERFPLADVKRDTEHALLVCFFHNMSLHGLKGSLTTWRIGRAS